jgi:pimeloyl-ACP methyl ester carboxylesterase
VDGVKKGLLIVILVLAAAVAWANLFPAQFMGVALTAERDRNGLSYKTTEVDGETWHYLEGGIGQAETVVMVHGFGGDKDNWTRFAGSITPFYHVISMDLPGFGQSARHEGWSYRIGDQADRVHKFLTSIGVNRFHLVGNSMGGNLTGVYTHRYPDSVITMGLFNNSGTAEPVASEMTKRREAGEPNPLVISAIEEYDALLDFVSVKKPWLPAPAKKYFAQKALDNAAFNTYIFNQYKGDRGAALEDKLPSITQPTLILWGDGDDVLDKSRIDVMTPLLANETVVIMPETGHVPMAERPGQTAQHYLSFINQH